MKFDDRTIYVYKVPKDVQINYEADLKDEWFLFADEKDDDYINNLKNEFLKDAEGPFEENQFEKRLFEEVLIDHVIYLGISKYGDTYEDGFLRMIGDDKLAIKFEDVEDNVSFIRLKGFDYVLEKYNEALDGAKLMESFENMPFFRITSFVLNKNSDIRYQDTLGIKENCIVSDYHTSKEVAYETIADYIFNHFFDDYGGDNLDFLQDDKYKKCICIEKVPAHKLASYLTIGSNGEPVFWADEYGNIAYGKNPYKSDDHAYQFTVSFIPIVENVDSSSDSALFRCNRDFVGDENAIWENLYSLSQHGNLLFGNIIAQKTFGDFIIENDHRLDLFGPTIEMIDKWAIPKIEAYERRQRGRGLNDNLAYILDVTNINNQNDNARYKLPAGYSSPDPFTDVVDIIIKNTEMEEKYHDAWRKQRKEII